MRILGSFIIILIIANCKFQDLKVDRYFSKTLNESKKNNLFIFEMKELNIDNQEDIIDFCWVEKKAKYKAGLSLFVDIEPGYGLHIKFKRDVSSHDTLELIDLVDGTQFNQWMTYGEEENNRVYFINLIRDNYLLAAVINSDTLGKFILERK